MENKITPPIVLFKTTSELFKKARREGNKCAFIAQILFQEFMEIALRRDTRTIEATEAYIRNKEKGLGLSEREYNDSKSLLRKLGLIGNTYFNKKTKKHVFEVIFNPMSAQYQEFLKEKLNKKEQEKTKIRSDKTEQIRSDNMSLQYKTTSIKYKTTSKKKLSSKEERVSTDTTKKKRLILVSKKKSNPDPQNKPCLKIQKKSNINQGSLNLDGMSASPDKKVEYKPKHKATVPVTTCYNSLLMLGATKHREGTAAYHRTMDFLYELLHPEVHFPPYCKSKYNIPDDYRVKHWTVDELIETFKFYMEHDENKTHRNIKDFILAERFNEKSWSPLIRSHKMMLAAQGMEYDGDEKRLFKELERLNFTKGIGPKEIRRIIRLLDIYCANLHVNESLAHIYYGKVVFAFGQFIAEKIRQASFKSHYLLSEKVMQEFVDTFSERGVLIQNGYRY